MIRSVLSQRPLRTQVSRQWNSVSLNIFYLCIYILKHEPHCSFLSDAAESCASCCCCLVVYIESATSSAEATSVMPNVDDSITKSSFYILEHDTDKQYRKTNNMPFNQVIKAAPIILPTYRQYDRCFPVRTRTYFAICINWEFVEIFKINIRGDRVENEHILESPKKNRNIVQIISIRTFTRHLLWR